jgi:hypothetical protein
LNGDILQGRGSAKVGKVLETGKDRIEVEETTEESRRHIQASETPRQSSKKGEEVDDDYGHDCIEPFLARVEDVEMSENCPQIAASDWWILGDCSLVSCVHPFDPYIGTSPLLLSFVRIQIRIIISRIHYFAYIP